MQNIFTDEEKAILDAFKEKFYVVVHSMASQILTIDSSTGFESYDDTEVYGETSLIEIFYKDEVIYKIEKPRNDIEAVLNYAKSWNNAGRPTPEDNLDLFTSFNLK
ncbi:MAG: hypothetical protein IJ880_07295 [Bacilli bacterium]|nr:hypothetical protein [Bacilli bacterium]MBR3119747.1 hypothetical protein [Oceanobacillus sp.]